MKLRLVRNQGHDIIFLILNKQLSIYRLCRYKPVVLFEKIPWYFSQYLGLKGDNHSLCHVTHQKDRSDRKIKVLFY